jgi:peptidoglycan/xylan/chitin deacetylase (PgdA/CDA1 family)
MSHVTAPLLVTVDVEIAHDRDLQKQAETLWRLCEQLRPCPTTWFCTAEAAERFAAPLRELAQSGHTIGCHGLDHGQWEDYRRLSPAQALQTLAEATDRVEAAVGVRPRVFRGPRMTTSAATQAALRKLRYAADFSVCARRFDLMAASGFHRRWLTTGPAPYCPDRDDPFAAANEPLEGDLVVIPLSGFGVPLVSGALYTLGHRPMLSLVKLMARAAARSQAPVVYLFHSYEFADVSGLIDHRPIHHRLYPASAEKRFLLNQHFLESLQGSIGLEPVSADQYIGGLSHDTAPYQTHDSHRGRALFWSREGRGAHAGTHHAWSAKRQSLADSVDRLQIGDGSCSALDEDAPIHHPLR